MRTGAVKPRAPAWEESPGADGPLAFVWTLLQLARPFRFFQSLPEQRFWSGVRFGLICHGIQCLAPLLPWTVIAVRLSIARYESVGALCTAQIVAYLTAFLVAVAVASGLFRLFVIGGFEYLLLRLVGCAPAGFRTTVRANGYAHAATLAGAFPQFWWAGEVAHAVWRLVAYRNVHGIRGARVLATLLVVVIASLPYFLSQDLMQDVFKGITSGFQQGLRR